MDAGILTVGTRRRAATLTSRRIATIAVAAITSLRLIAAFRLHGPILMPDEYFYTAIARSVAHGSWPVVRGGGFDFLAVLAPILQSPAWLIHDVALAYRVVQAEGVLAIGAAAIPAFALSRHLGLSERSAATAAVLAVLGPDLAYGGSLLSEPLAYPLFLTAVLFAVDAIRTPSAGRQTLFLFVAGLLCLTRLQFVFVPLIYLAAAAVARRPFRLVGYVREQRLALGALGLAACVAVAGHSAAAGRYSGMRSFAHAPEAVAGWAGANLVVLFVAAGWVTAPGAALGLSRLVRSNDVAGRAFATIAALATLALVAEAAFFGAGLEQLEERYTFYAVPLLLIAFLYAVERGLLKSRAHMILAASLAFGSVFVPLYDRVFSAARDGSMSLLVYVWLEGRAHWSASLLVGGVLLALALAGLALARRGNDSAFVALAAVLPLALTATLMFELPTLTGVAAQNRWRVQVSPSRAAFLAFPGSTNPSDLTTALFWNPGIDRVLVLGGRTVDSFASVPVRLVAGRLVQSDGAQVSGDVVFQSQFDTVESRGAPISMDGDFGIVHGIEHSRIDAAIVGWSQATGRLQPTGEVVLDRMSGARRKIAIRLLAPPPNVKGISIRCEGGAMRVCRFAIKGPVSWRAGGPQTFAAQVALKPSSTTADR